MSCNLETATINYIAVFKKYAGKDGDATTLSKDELCDLAVKEYPTLCANEKKDAILKGVIGQMDMDGDNKITFKEFMIFNACLALTLEKELCK